jgi:hypothetical protein
LENPSEGSAGVLSELSERSEDSCMSGRRSTMVPGVYHPSLLSSTFQPSLLIVLLRSVLAGGCVGSRLHNLGLQVSGSAWVRREDFTTGSGRDGLS